MFSITLVNIDSYQASPIPELDVTFSEFRGSEIRKVPIIRIFGSTVTGKKTCLHIHGVFPYMYVPCTIQENTDSYAYQLAASIDSALNKSFGSTLSTNQHVYKIQRVSGIPFYGYHEKEHLFFKIYFYNPAIIKRTADLLQNGAILNQTLQPYEAHIPYILQFMIDYNLYGMNLINLNNIKYRCSLQECTTEDSQNKSSMDLINPQMYLPTSVMRQSMCELEVDAHASDILNKQNVNEKLELNPGLAAIWNEEKARRAAVGLENAKSQLLYPKTPSKIILSPTDNDIYQKNQLLKRLNATSQINETIISNPTVSSYPIEVEANENILNASCIINHNESLACEETIERTFSDNYKLLQVTSSAFLEANRSQSNVTDTSILDADDIQLVEMLADLAEENDIKSNVDDDSVLGSQYSVSSEPVKNDPEEEEIEDLNITSLDLDDLSTWESMHKGFNQNDNVMDVREIINNKQTDSVDDVNITEESSIDVTLRNFPQLDGIDNLYGNIFDYETETINDIRNISKNNTAACCTVVQTCALPICHSGIMSATAKSSCRTCCFCNLTEDNELEYGKFHEYNGIFTHYYCLLLSSNMEQKGSDDEGILGFLTEDIQKELNRGKRLVCSYCKKIGATLGCCNVRCKRIFHFPCGLKAGSLHQYFGEFRSYCINHRPKQKIEAHILKQIKSLDNILCCICYDKVNPTDFVKSLWAPCCKKNAFFHRKCVQQLASSAGYFFKCPLCNNKQDFRNAMLEYGIFIPSQDASWELVPNAFEELLYRHDQCDAVKCLCPKGRKHVSSNAKWELILCRTCGSQGIHMACGQLKWANPVWDCTECTSILRNSKNNEDAKSDNISDDLSRDSDSDSDTDISVGMDFPMLCPSSSFKLSSNSSSFKLSSNSSSLLDSTSDISLRPGPRSFKLQQQINKRLELTRDQQNDDKMKHIKVSQDTNALLKNDNEKNDKKEKSLTNKENNTQKEKQISNSDNSVTSHSIQKETDVITIESDDDNEVEIITLKQKTGLSALKQSTSQSSIPRVPLSKNKQLNTVKNSTSNLSAISSNLLEKDIVELHKSVASESKISNENKSIYLISEQFDVAALQESMPDVISNSNDLDNVDTVDTSPVMNIKITDVISLPPELFESVPDVTLHENSIDTTSPSTSKSLEKLVAYIAPSKRIYEGAINTGYSKKVKGDNYEKFSANDSVTFNYHINTFDASKENGKISSLKSNEVHKNKNSLNCTSANKLSNSYNNQKDNLLTQMSSHKMDDMRHTNQVAGNYLEDNATLLQVQQNSENPVVNGTYLPSSKCKNPLFFPLANVYDTTLNSNDTNSQDTKNKGNMHLTNIIMPMTNVINPQTIVVNQSVTFNGSMPVIANDNQMKMLDKNKVVLMREKMFANVSSPNDSSNNIFCDGDAGTCCPAEINSTGRKKTNPSTKSCGSVDSNNAAVESHNPVATRSVFPRITNNHSTCHQPRLIPQYMNLHDLKFRACKPDNVQMVLYDTFSVNIPIKNSKESKIRSANVTAQQELKESSYYATDEASSNAEYIDDIQTVEQQFKFSRSSKNENLVNDKTKYVIHGQDDTKENLDPIRSKMLSRNSTYNNSLVNDSGDTVTIHDSFCGETGNEIRLASSDTNLSALNRTICNKNVEDTVKDDIAFVSNDRNKILHGSWQDVQQHKQVSVQDMTPPCTEEKFVRFYKENNRIVHNIDFDFNIVKTNKNIEKILQDDMTVSTNQHNKDNNIIDNDYIDDSQTMLQNGYKHLACTNVTRPKLSNIMFNEHSILNKQINKSDSEINQRLTFDENTVNRNSENNFKHNNSECCCKISIDLCRIQSLIDSKPELFVNQKCNVDDKWCKYKSQL
ncbi:uncharacterized protein LOC105259473 [Camponotus floridanus]|uniref:uncharacterized protein LOC105259473 n=1 Tax=Camponotus floridanus TaxID=104421 RepID=UPI000DC6CEF3|nr:uncharacterized protein LOC105259473 [Camponotus floridanus]